MKPEQRSILMGQSAPPHPEQEWQKTTETWSIEIGFVTAFITWSSRTKVWTLTAPELGIHNPIALASVAVEDATTEATERLRAWLGAVLQSLPEES